MLKRRIRTLAAAAAVILSAAALADTGTVPAHAATPDAWLVLQASKGCYLYAPGHNVQLIVDCNPSAPRDTWRNIRPATFFDPLSPPGRGSYRTAYELEITSGPSAGLCLNDDPADGDAVAADSCQPADANEYFWVDNTKIADTHWYRNVTATNDSWDSGGGYHYLTDFVGCLSHIASTGDPMVDAAGGCGGYGAWTAITS
jgi:hypothetical protein